MQPKRKPGIAKELFHPVITKKRPFRRTDRTQTKGAFNVEFSEIMFGASLDYEIDRIVH